MDFKNEIDQLNESSLSSTFINLPLSHSIKEHNEETNESNRLNIENVGSGENKPINNLHRSLTWPSVQPNCSSSNASSVIHSADSPVTDSQHVRSQSLGQRINQSLLQKRESLRSAAKKITSIVTGSKEDVIFRKISVIPERTDPLIDSKTNSPFISNSITTSRYTFFNFLPKQLYAQFSKIANVYFLFVALIQTGIPTGQFTTLIPLSVFLSIAMAHEGFDDYRRHKQDTIENNNECSVLNVYRSNDVTSSRLGVWRKTKWKSLRVGDLVSVKAQEWVPADLLLLHSKGEKGACFVETAALDGETNLKQKQALKDTNNTLVSPEALANFKATVCTENPNQDLYNFDGSIELSDGKMCALSNDQILLRGTVLRNTPEIYGLVIFTGEETKLRMNASKNVRTKAPMIQQLVNKVVIIIFVFVMFLSVFCTMMSEIWIKHFWKNAWYVFGIDMPLHISLFSFIILFNTMIPISLYVTMEIIKLVQVYFINKDINMYHVESDTPAEARTATINEELGQVSYVFSDKTGTLTDNIMLFRKISVGGRAFLHDMDLCDTEDELSQMLDKRQNSVTKRQDRFSYTSIRRNRTLDNLEDSEDNQMESLKRRDSSLSNWRFSMIAPTVTGPSPLYKSDSISRSTVGSITKDRDSTIDSTIRLLSIIQHKSHTPFGEKARFFLLAIALCHTCVPEIDPITNDVFYQAASPDEFALVNAAKELGYIVMDRSMSSVSLLINNDGPAGLKDPNNAEKTYETYQILNVIEFSSKRKRMSVIYRLPNGKICLLCKGADSIILERLINPSEKLRQGKDASGSMREKFNEINLKGNIRANTSIHRDIAHIITDSICNSPTSLNNDGQRYSITIDPEHDPFPTYGEKWLYSKTMHHVQQFATEGLRTLLYGHRYLEEDEYNEWNKLYQEASTAIVDRQKKLEQIAEMIEKDLEITGATAIEDKLQDGVPETIEKLRRAGIKIWMLTGDKRETAINIGYSCSLIKNYSTTIIIDQCFDLNLTLKQALENIYGNRGKHVVAVVDGATLMVIEQDDVLMEKFVELGIICDSVICCRVSPSQKALVVRNIRRKLSDIVTLAIGDGANDIAMIQEAHVGIGITGREGLQAARTSDYSIAQFRFLSNLLFVHGRWSYIRVSKFILGTFYKCMCFYLTQGIFQLFTGFSGTSLYEQWTLSFYNTLFSSLPVMVIGMFEKDLNYKTLLGVPELYTQGQRNDAFNLKIFITWMSDAFIHALVIVMIPFILHGIPHKYEFRRFESPQLYELGLTVYTCVVFVVTIKIAYVECHNWTAITHATSFLTLFGWFLYQIIYSLVYPIDPSNATYDVRGVFQRDGTKSEFWITVLLTTFAAIIPNILTKIGKNVFYFTDVDKYQAIEKDDEYLQKIIDEGVNEEFRDDDIQNEKDFKLKKGKRKSYTKNYKTTIDNYSINRDYNLDDSDEMIIQHHEKFVERQQT
ncbi:26679_t:CDS:2 [Dentiscutata erythropus]|uniref:Phospholipid-transporting ATPase n=1 Tax=Dentiscutata erythropus TaxID=1348616 RepID=A0A9N8Z4Q7_9GLOM|nr:26679_t:CDS:2 [Dentiscutata erythropus]